MADNPKVLLVDDDPDFVEATKLILENNILLLHYCFECINIYLRFLIHN